MISVIIELTTHPSLVMYHYTHWAQRQRHAAVVKTIRQALRGGHEKSVVGKKFICQFGKAANWESLSVNYFVQALHMPRSKNSSGVYRPKYIFFRTSCLSGSASTRVHVEVGNGYGRVRGVGAAPRRRRSNEAI